MKLTFHKKIHENYALELDLLRKICDYKNGIMFFDIDCELRLRGDHTPHFMICIILLNIKIIEFGIYNLFHEETFINGELDTTGIS